MANGEVQLMYLLFRYHHILPSVWEEMGFGEKTIVRAFMHHEIETRNEEIEQIQEMWR